MWEIMQRIGKLKAFREALINGKVADDITFPAAIDWIDNTIAELNAELDKLPKAA